MIGARSVQSGIAALAAWWLKALHASLPEAVRRLGEPPQPMRMVVQADDSDVVVSLVDPSGDAIFTETLARGSYERSLLDRCFAKAAAYGRRRDIALTLGVPWAITRSLVIPRRARSAARAIVLEHIRRKTPLKSDEIFIGLDLRPAGEDKIELRYLVLPRGALDGQLAFLGLAPSELSALQGRAVAGERPVTVAFPDDRAPRKPLAKWAVLFCLALSLVAAGIGLGAAVWRQHSLLAELDERLSKLASPARQSSERFKTIQTLAHDVRAFGDLRAAPGALQIWEELARILPTSTYLTDADIRAFEVHLTGFAESASDLIHIIERSPILHNASLTGRVAFDKGRGKEHFMLRASVRASRLPAEERE